MQLNVTVESHDFCRLLSPENSMTPTIGKPSTWIILELCTPLQHANQVTRFLINKYLVLTLHFSALREVLRSTDNTCVYC